MKQFLAPLALLAARAAMPEVESGDDVSGCAGSGLYIIAIRGTGELQGIGVAGSLIGKPVKDEIKDSKLVSLTYPASLSDPNYILSVGNGTTSLNDLINSHVQACPSDKIAIIGYSQGAQVTLDTLCGTDETGFTETAAIASDKIDKHSKLCANALR